MTLPPARAASAAGPPEAPGVAAVDLGATSGRVMLGRFTPGGLTVEVVHRFPNRPVRVADGLHWDIGDLYRNVVVGLRKAVEIEPALASIGIDTWAVDYGLLRGDSLIVDPFHYRDERSARGVELVHAVIAADDLYAASGLQFLPFNTLYQLAVDQEAGRLAGADTMLMIPDLLAFWLTGERRAERTNASTTGLLDATTGEWNTALIDKLGVPAKLFPPLVAPGERIGVLSDSMMTEIGATTPIPVVAVGSHDTASAVVGVPMQTADAAYISSGTWSLVGLELDGPILTPAGREANFTNEGGVDGRVRFLHNVMGMWLLSESVRAWESDGRQVDLGALLADAAALPGPVATFDANDPSLLPAGDMPARIAALCVADGQPAPGTPAEFARSICESLAKAYADALEVAETLSGRAIGVVHVVGGGSQNALLCQLTADRTGRRVLAGPVEATAVGNVLVQARAAGLVSGSLEDLRGLVADSFPVVAYEPATARSGAR